jgi:hypothetical protein
MTPVLIQTLEAANRELSKLRIKVDELTAVAEKHAKRRYEVEEQLIELLNYRSFATNQQANTDESGKGQ